MQIKEKKQRGKSKSRKYNFPKGGVEVKIRKREKKEMGD